MKNATAIGLAHALSAAATEAEVHLAIEMGLTTVLNAQVASLATIDMDSRELRFRPVYALAQELNTKYQRVSLDTPLPITEVARTGEMLVLPDRAAWSGLAPQSVIDDLIASGLVATVLVPLKNATGAVTAVLGVSWSHPVDLDPESLDTLTSVARLCERALERAVSTDLATQRSRALAHLASRLADALTAPEVLDTLARLGHAPVGAMATSLGLIDTEAQVLRTRHGNSVGDDVTHQFTDPPLHSRLAFTDAARTGEAILLPTYQAYLDHYPDGAPATASLGFGARAAVPIRGSDDAVLGSMVHAWRGPRWFDEALLSTMTTIAEMTGQALERAALLETIQADAARHEALASLAESLAAAQTSQRVAAVIPANAAIVAGAETANVALIGPDNDTLEVHHHPTVAAQLGVPFTRFPLRAPTPQSDVVRDGSTLVFESAAAFIDRYPHLEHDLRGTGTARCAVTPLIDSSGRCIGALGIAWTSPGPVDERTRAALVEVARVCAQALERAQLSDAEHRLTMALRESLMVPLPQPAGCSIAGRHRAAAPTIGMGGDWYQGIVLSDHRYALIVGDVEGHGIASVAKMAQVQTMIATLVRLDACPAEALQQASTLLRADKSSVRATVLLVLIDARSSTLTYVAAGHPPPLLRTPDGQSVILDGGRQPLLGVPVDRSVEVGRAAFPPGSVLVAYTDGLIESRHETIDDSIKRLTGHLEAAAPGGADSIADELLSTLPKELDPDDDVALVVVARTLEAGP